MRTLTEKMIKTGESIVQLLHEKQFPFRAALWLYMTDGRRWHLYLAVPNVRAEGSAKIYKKLISLLDKDLDMDMFPSVVDAKAPIGYSCSPIKVGDVTGCEFISGTLKGREFDDAYIYPLPETPRRRRRKASAVG
jgi:hypothetical protein